MKGGFLELEDRGREGGRTGSRTGAALVDIALELVEVSTGGRAGVALMLATGDVVFDL